MATPKKPLISILFYHYHYQYFKAQSAIQNPKINIMKIICGWEKSKPDPGQI
jgi:hypothetical protein